MAAIKSKGTVPEIVVRKILTREGYKYRLHRKNIHGKPDIYIKKLNLAIFINGCFWHQHKKCKYSTIPKSNRMFWREKLKNNTDRDRINARLLKKAGYKILTLWECEIIDKNRKLIKSKIIETKIQKYKKNL